MKLVDFRKARYAACIDVVRTNQMGRKQYFEFLDFSYIIGRYDYRPDFYNRYRCAGFCS